MIITAPQQAETENPIASGAFWPAISPAEIRAQQRIDNTVTAPRLRGALIEAIASTNNALRAWRMARADAGFETLADVDADEIDGVSVLIHRYQRAVGCLAKALLLERHRDMDSTAAGDRRADALADPIDDCRRDHLHAIAAIAGRPRCTVELI